MCTLWYQRPPHPWVPFTQTHTWAYADNSHLWCPSDSPRWHLAGEVESVCACVSVCVCMCVFVSAGLCAEGKTGWGGGGVGWGGDEVTRVVVQMSPQSAEPHEWRLLWWWRGNALEAWPTHSSHLNGWNSAWSKRQAHACRVETKRPLHSFFSSISLHRFPSFFFGFELLSLCKCGCNFHCAEGFDCDANRSG